MMNPALIILDMANGYGWKPGSFGYEMVEKVKNLKDAAHAAGVPVIHVNSLRRISDNVGEWDKVLMKEKSDAIEVIPELHPVDRDIIVYKRYLSGFSYNDLDYVLRTLNCDTVLIAGASTDNTVLWTSADAFQLRYKVVVVEDCTMVHRESEPPEVKEYALRIVRNVLHSKVLPLSDVVNSYMNFNSK
ncbi:MAG: hypothetical protein CL763_02105 [Chloroflexi bacterium]|nr:hypothetical protein [Chloroflexota bacterium]|tara:strand:+ start:359 stop:922 length:564 start_codon:yes stop_codon:yes gene_type:complete